MNLEGRRTSQRSPIDSRRYRWTIALLVLILVLSGSSVLSYSPLTVEWKKERLSVVAEQVPLARILQEIAHRTGLKIQGHEALQSEVSVRFSGLPLGEALDRLLVHTNYLTVEEPSSQGGTRPVLALVLREKTAGEKSAPLTQVRPQVLGAAPEGTRMDHEKSGAAETAEVQEGAAEENPRDQEHLAALEAFAEQGDVAALQLALLDPNPTVQMRALTLMLERDTPRTIDLLVRMAKSGDPAARRQALHLLYINGLVDPSVSLEDALEGRDILPIQDPSQAPS